MIEFVGLFHHHSSCDGLHHNHRLSWSYRISLWPHYQWCGWSGPRSPPPLTAELPLAGPVSWCRGRCRRTPPAAVTGWSRQSSAGPAPPGLATTWSAGPQCWGYPVISFCDINWFSFDVAKLRKLYIFFDDSTGDNWIGEDQLKLTLASHRHCISIDCFCFAPDVCFLIGQSGNTVGA